MDESSEINIFLILVVGSMMTGKESDLFLRFFKIKSLVSGY